MNPMPIVITEKEYRKARDTFDAQSDMTFVPCAPEEKSVADAIRKVEARAVILGVEPYTEELYRSLPRGGVISRFGVGHDGIDKRRATEAGIWVTNTPGVLEDAVAEHTLALMLAWCKRLPSFVRAMDAGRWDPVPTLELRGRRLVVVGCGAIGRRVARGAAFGFGMHVTGVDTRDMDPAELQRDWGMSSLTGSLASAIAAADVVSLHVPANEDTFHLIDREVLGGLAPGSLLINTSRGSVVDEKALFEALASGRLGGAALDVFEVEPYEPRDPDHDLRRLPNVLLTPHVSSGTVEACGRVAAASVRNIRQALAGNGEAVHLLNPDVLA